MAKAKNGTSATKPRGDKVLEVKGDDGESREATIARLALTPGIRHAALGNSFAASLFSPNHSLAITDSAALFGDAMARARQGDKAFASDILAAQAMALDTMFTELAGRSFANLGQYVDAAERYMKLALKAQANCRATLEALAKLHQPREQIVKHVHVNEGGKAIVADHIHHHTGGEENGKSNGQSHATGAAGESPALLGADPQGNGVPISGGEGSQTVPDARRDQSRRA